MQNPNDVSHPAAAPPPKFLFKKKNNNKIIKQAYFQTANYGRR